MARWRKEGEMWPFYVHFSVHQDMCSNCLHSDIVINFDENYIFKKTYQEIRFGKIANVAKQGKAECSAINTSRTYHRKQMHLSKYPKNKKLISIAAKRKLILSLL